MSLLPVHDPGVHRHRGYWCRAAPWQRAQGLWQGDSVCNLWPRLYCSENTTAGNQKTGDPRPTIHQSYLNRRRNGGGGGLMGPMKWWRTSYICVACLTISVFEDSRMLDESHIPMPTCQTPEWTHRQTHLVCVMSSSHRSIGSDKLEKTFWGLVFAWK